MGPIFSRVRRLARGMALIPIALAIGAISASAAPIMITFDNDTPENNPDLLASGLIMGNYFTSVDSSQVHFVDTDILNPAGFEMFIQNESYTNDSNALGVGVDYDNSALRILLDVPATSISTRHESTTGGCKTPPSGRPPDPATSSSPTIRRYR